MAQPFSGIVGLWRMRSCADDRQQQTFCALRILIERNADSTLVKRDAFGTPQAIVQRPPFVRLVQSFQVKVKDCLRMTDRRDNADKTTDQDSRSQLHRSVQVCLLEATKSRLGATQEYGKCSMAPSVSGVLSSYGRSGSWAVRRQVDEKRPTLRFECLPIHLSDMPTIRTSGRTTGAAECSRKSNQARTRRMSISRSTYFHSSVFRSVRTSSSNASECWGAYSNHVRKSKGSPISRL